MKFLSWNCQGLGSSLTVQSLKELHRKFKFDIVFLMETRNSRKKLEKVRNKLRLPNGVYVDPVGLGGGLALWWSREVDIHIRMKSRNFIDSTVSFIHENISCRITWVYASSVFKDRMENWDALRRLKGNIQLAWLCVGDFNEIVDQFEKGGGEMKQSRNICNFQKLISDLQLVDVGFHGPRFTWCNKIQGEGRVKERLDRALVSTEWRALFPKTQVLHEPCIGSDHLPLVVNTEWNDARGSKRFRFESMWTTSEECRVVINGVWVRSRDQELSLIRNKLYRCSLELTDWSKKIFPNNCKEIEDLKKLLAKEQDNDPANNFQETEDELIGKISELWRNEEMFWHQRSRINWLNFGDRNTTFFHQCTVQRRARNKVIKIQNMQGLWLDKEEDIMNAFTDYF